MNISEPITMLTDYIIAVESFIFALLLLMKIYSNIQQLVLRFMFWQVAKSEENHKLFNCCHLTKQII